MATKNLDLEGLSGGAFVDKDLFNRNWDKIDPLGACYVVASGMQGEWWYRKWSDGRVDCGIDDKAFPDQVKTPWGNTSMYRTGEMTFGAYPFSFASRPYSRVEFNDNTASDHASYVSQHATSSTTQSPAFALCDPNGGTVGQPHFGIFVSGKVAGTA